MSVRKTRRIKSTEYEQKYGHIPVNYDDRLRWMIDHYNLSEKQMDLILEKRQSMLNNLIWYDYKVLELLEEPEGASRPKVRVLRNNFNKLAQVDPGMVHIYVPGAGDDRKYMQRIVDTQELNKFDSFIYTPCDIEYNMFIKTPSYFNITDIFLAEIGLIRAPVKPDWDNAGKKYCDMFNSNIWLDDSLVIDGSVHKYYSILPRVEINLRYLNVLYTKHQYTSLLKRKDIEKVKNVGYLNNKGEIMYE